MTDSLALLAIAGGRLADSDAAALEAVVAENPDDLDARARLVGYYGNDRFDDDKALARVRHVEWFIQNRPANGFSGSPACGALPPDAGWARLRAAWMSWIDKPTLDPLIVLNAADFFTIGDKTLRRELLERGERAAPTWPHWSERLGQDLMRSVHTARPGADTVDDRVSSTAGHALRHFERALYEPETTA